MVSCLGVRKWSTIRRDVRAVEGTGLENRRGASLRGFESHSLRQLHIDLRKYPSGRRGSPAKGVDCLKNGARVQIPPSAPARKMVGFKPFSSLFISFCCEFIAFWLWGKLQEIWLKSEKSISTVYTTVYKKKGPYQLWVQPFFWYLILNRLIPFLAARANGGRPCRKGGCGAGKQPWPLGAGLIHDKAIHRSADWAQSQVAVWERLITGNPSFSSFFT